MTLSSRNCTCGKLGELGESRGQMAGVGRSAAIPSSVVWTHLDKVGLILLVSRGYEPVYFAA